eukprot:1161080-Pelagomonas_calceolata.AAC.5
MEPTCSLAAQQQCCPRLCVQGCSWCLPAIWCSSHGTLSVNGSSSRVPRTGPDYPPSNPSANLPTELVPPAGMSTQQIESRSSISASQGWAHSLVCMSTPEASWVWGSGCNAHGQLGELLQQHREERPVPASQEHQAPSQPQLSSAGQHVQDKPGQQQEGFASDPGGNRGVCFGSWVPINLPSRVPIRMVAAGECFKWMVVGVKSPPPGKHGARANLLFSVKVGAGDVYGQQVQAVLFPFSSTNSTGGALAYAWPRKGRDFRGLLLVKSRMVGHSIGQLHAPGTLREALTEEASKQKTSTLKQVTEAAILVDVLKG